MNIKEEIHALSDEMLEKLERLVVIPFHRRRTNRRKTIW